MTMLLFTRTVVYAAAALPCKFSRGQLFATRMTAPVSIILPHQVQTQYLHFKFHANHFLLPEKIPKEISRRSMLFHN